MPWESLLEWSLKRLMWIVSLNCVESILGSSVRCIVGGMLRLNGLERKMHTGTHDIALGNVETKNNHDQKKRCDREGLQLQQATAFLIDPGLFNNQNE
jgi:hypothetical protein